MTTDDVLNEFRAAGALREGHFVLSSGLHSPVFLQKNLVFMHADRTERLCTALADKIKAAVGAWACRRCTSSARVVGSSCGAASTWSRAPGW
jgi:orotate phosphoribosyltransferase